MKKRVKIVLCAVLALLLIAGGVTWSFLPHPLNYKIGSIEAVGSGLEVTGQTEDCVTVKKTGDGAYKVLMFTDMHLDGKNSTSSTTVSRMVESIQKEKPDLVLLCGDNVTSGLNRVRCRQLGKIFEKLGVYWAGTLGNHEGDNSFSISRGEMMDEFCSFEHCLMKKGKADVTGDCNYALHLLDRDGAHVETFFFLDTFDEMNEAQLLQYGYAADDSVYDGTKEDQVEWYQEKLAETKSRYGACRSIMMLHIPLPQFQTAVDAGEPFLYGDKREGICCSGFDSGLFDAIKAGGSTQAVFCGHDHVNNFGVTYDGVLLSYIEMSGYGSYSMITRGAPEEEWLQGYTALELHADGSFDQQQVRYVES
ncbi:MAG: metallophosphoesterase [Clostridia bacterium]|nr:metallophosphoesterase [Clostridia bacterium]